MPDYGLIQGLAEAFKGGLGAYNETKKNAEDLALKKRANQLAMMKDNVQETPEGGLAFTPGEQAKKDYEAGQYDPEGAESQTSRKLARGLLKSGGVENAEGLIPENATAKELQGESSLLGKTLSGVYGMQGRQLSNDRMQTRNDLMRDRLDFSKDKYASEAGNHVENDHIMKQLKSSTNNIDRAMAILDNPKIKINSQMLNMLQQDVSNAMAPGGAATEGKMNMDIVHPYLASINNVLSKAGSVQDMRTELPELMAQLRSTMTGARSEFGSAMAKRNDELSENYSMSNIPGVKGMLEKKKTRYSSQPEGLMNTGAPATTSNAEDQAALAWAAKNPNSPHAAEIKKGLGVK